MTEIPKPIEYNGYRITLIAEDGGYEAHTERLDKRPIGAGYSLGNATITHRYAEAEHAFAAAKAAIDSGEVK